MDTTRKCVRSCPRLLSLDAHPTDNHPGGGHNYFSVFLSGTVNNVDSYVDDTASSSSSSAAASSTTAAPSTTKAPTGGAVSTSIAPGTTVVVTMPSSEQQTQTPDAATGDKSGGGSSTNVAGIAAGVVVGVVAVAGIAIGLFFFMRHRKRKAAEEEFKRTQVGDFMRHGGTSGEGKPPNTGYSNMSDSRLDPEANKRNSTGSIADNQDYSRRILRVSMRKSDLVNQLRTEN
jgi:cell wall integrity and stress response component